MKIVYCFQLCFPVQSLFAKLFLYQNIPTKALNDFKEMRYILYQTRLRIPESVMQ